MKCVISTVEIHNFMSFENSTLDFSANLGITAVMGVNNDVPGAANGSGKSNAVRALFYCLYGKSAIRTNNKFLKNTCTDKAGFHITATLTIDDVVFKIRRGADAANTSFLTVHKRVSDDFVDITLASIAETEKLIIKLLNGLTADIFLKTVYLTPAFGTRFFDLTPSNQIEFLNLVSGTNKIYAANAAITKDINEINTQIRIIDNALITLTKQRDDLTAKKAEFDQQLIAAKQQHNDTSADLRVHNDKVRQDIADNAEQILALQSDVNAALTVQTQLLAELSELKQNLNTLDAAKRTLIAKNKHIVDFVAKHKKLCDIVCSDCTPKVQSELALDTMLTDKQSNDDMLTRVNIALQQCVTQHTNKEKEHRLHSDAVAKQRSALSKLIAARSQLERVLDANVCKLQLLHDNATQAETEPFTDMLIANSSDIDAQHALKNAQIKQRQCLSILKYATDTDTVRTFVTSKFVQHINQYIAQYLSAMGVNYYCKFNNDLSYTFMSMGGEMSYANFSSGEQMRLNIAISFAFRKLLMLYLNIDVNVLILDEYLDSNLDTLAITGITSMLSDIKQNPFYNIYLISHRKEFLSGNIDNVMTITKTNGISTINV